MTTTDLAAAILRDVPTRYQPVNGDRLLHESDVLAALTAAMDPALSERAGEVQKDLKLFRAVWGELPSVAPHIATAPGVTTGSVISACDRAASLITTLLTANAALRAERDELSSKLEVERALTDAVHRLAKAAEAQNAALTARVEGLTGAGKALASWCVKNIQLNLEMDTALHALDAALSATEATDDPR